MARLRVSGRFPDLSDMFMSTARIGAKHGEEFGLVEQA